jgi:large subunit ribosomal protein L25
VEDCTLEIESRLGGGSAASRRYRRVGKIPAVVYYRSNPSISAVIDENDFIRVAKKSRSSQVFTLKSANAELNGLSVIVKDIQREYLKGLVLHVDFQSLREDEEIVVTVPLILEGEAPGVKLQGGVLSQMLHHCRVKCLPKIIPASVSVDVGNLEIGHSIHKGDIQLPSGVTLADEPGETIVTVVGTRASRMMADEVPSK